MKNTSLFLVFLFLIGTCYSQEETKKSFKLSSFSMSIGTNRASISSSKSDFLNLKGMVEDPELFINPDDFTNNFYYNETGSGTNTKIQIGITPYSKELGALNKNRELRLGVGMITGTRRSFNFRESETIVIDTFYSANGNPNIYQEKVSNEDYYYSEEYTELNFNIAYIFKTDIQKRIHFYVGFGAEYGFTLQSYIDVYHSKTSWKTYNTSNNNDQNNYYSPYSNVVEINGISDRTNLISPTHYIRAYIPLGVNFRFSNNNAFFKHLNLYSELNPGVEIQMAPKNHLYTNPYLGFAFVGLKYTF